MEQLPRYAIMTELIKELRAHNSWCGETHIQKTTYFLQELLRVPTAFEFILYMHGPFSFDLRDELGAMRAYQLLELESLKPYGPRWLATPHGEKFQGNYPVTLAKYKEQIEFVTDKLGDKRIGQLEKLATALYVTRADATKTDQQLAERINELKPHVTIEEARAALVEFHQIEDEARSRSLIVI
jgi:hypothetical protein